MKKLFAVSKLFTLLLGVLFFVQSCVVPDLSNCPLRNNVQIVVKLNTETSRATNDRYDIKNVVIYVFDKNDNTFVKKWRGPQYTFDKPYVAEMELIPGNYTFIIWTNHNDPYIPSYTREECYTLFPQIDELTLSFKYPEDKKVTADVPDLLWGKGEGQVKENQSHEFPVVMTPNIHKVNFTVKGLPVTSDTYEFAATDNYSQYGFADNNISATPDVFEYVRAVQFSANEIKASIKGLELNTDRDPDFYLRNYTKSEQIFCDKIVSMITKAYEKNNQTVDFSTTREFDIEITFSGLDVSISVNGWSYAQNDTDL